LGCFVSKLSTLCRYPYCIINVSNISFSAHLNILDTFKLGVTFLMCILLYFNLVINCILICMSSYKFFSLNIVIRYFKIINFSMLHYLITIFTVTLFYTIELVTNPCFARGFSNVFDKILYWKDRL
jgi:hypothetical protein